MLAYPAILRFINADFTTAKIHGTNVRPPDQTVTLDESQQHVIDPTNPRRALDYSIEHRLHVRGRAADNTEHLGRCRLMLQCLAQFPVAFLQFLEQANVLDGNYGLVGESLEKCDLLLGEGADFRAANQNCPNRNSVAHQRHDQYGSITFLVRESLGARKLHCYNR